MADLSDRLKVVPFRREHPVDLVLMDIRMPGIDEVVGGGGTLSARVTAALIGHMADNPPPIVDQGLLRRFDFLMIVSVARGLGNDGIAGWMFVSPLTVKTHVVRAMAKVGARDRALFVSFTFRAGLVLGGRASDRRCRSRRAVAAAARGASGLYAASPTADSAQHGATVDVEYRAGDVAGFR